MPKVQQVIPNHFSPRVACRDDNREAKRSRAGDWKVAVRGFAVVAVLALRERRPHSADGTKQRNGYAAPYGSPASRFTSLTATSGHPMWL